MLGLEAVPELVDAAPTAVVVMYGGVYGPHGEAAALTAGAYGYFVKGFDSPEQVIDVMVELIDMLRRRRPPTTGA